MEKGTEEMLTHLDWLASMDAVLKQELECELLDHFNCTRESADPLLNEAIDCSIAAARDFSYRFPGVGFSVVLDPDTVYLEQSPTGELAPTFSGSGVARFKGHELAFTVKYTPDVVCPLVVDGWVVYDPHDFAHMLDAFTTVNHGAAM